MEFLKSKDIRNVKRVWQRAATLRNSPHGLHSVSLLREVVGRIKMGNGDNPPHAGLRDGRRLNTHEKNSSSFDAGKGYC